MTNADFIAEFDLLYNNALGTSAPNINSYEKSLFLTQAQEIIIRGLYENKNTGLGFEQTEKIRRRLEPLTKTGKVEFSSVLDTSLVPIKLNSNSKFFQISDSAWYILYEQVITDSNKSIKVIPISLDQYNLLIENPFKKPNSRKAWRLDVSNTVSNESVVEIISTNTLSTYVYRYLSQPTPIVLVDLSTDPEFAGLGLSIHGVTDETESILSPELHWSILTKAVDLGTLAYKENTLSNNVQLNQNNNF